MIGGLIWNARSMSVVALVCFLIGATTGWKVNGWRLGNAIEQQKAEASRILALETEKARKTERRFEQIKNDLDKAHVTYSAEIEKQLADNRRLSRQLGGLRDPGRRIRCTYTVPEPAEASGEHPTTAAEGGLPETSGGFLSDEASEFIIELAADADRAAAYAKTCHDWAMTNYQIDSN